jgi:hypothetical protein
MPHWCGVTSLLVLECKTGVQITTEGGSQAILNRLDSLRRHVGGAMGETWLLTARRLHPGTGSAARAGEGPGEEGGGHDFHDPGYLAMS